MLFEQRLNAASDDSRHVTKKETTSCIAFASQSTSECDLNASWVHSHFYSELPACDRIRREGCSDQVWTALKERERRKKKMLKGWERAREEKIPHTQKRRGKKDSYFEKLCQIFFFLCRTSRGRSLHDITEYHSSPHDGAWVSAENGAAGERTKCVTDVSAAHILRLSPSALSPAPPPPPLLRAASETRAGKAAGRRMREADTRGEIALTGLAPISLTQITGRAARQWVR